MSMQLYTHSSLPIATCKLPITIIQLLLSIEMYSRFTKNQEMSHKFLKSLEEMIPRYSTFVVLVKYV